MGPEEIDIFESLEGDFDKTEQITTDHNFGVILRQSHKPVATLKHLMELRIHELLRESILNPSVKYFGLNEDQNSLIRGMWYNLHNMGTSNSNS